MRPDAIPTVAELIDELSKGSAATYAGTLERYRADLNDLSPYLRWNTRHYTRTCLYRGTGYELLVVCYGPGQQTSIHGHDGHAMWIRTLMGEVLEERYRLLPGQAPQLVQETYLLPGGGDLLIEGAGVHRFVNVGSGPAITLELHAGPLRKWRMYHEHPGRTHRP